MEEQTQLNRIEEKLDLLICKLIPKEAALKSMTREEWEKLMDF